jgi:hypothetical protein
MLKNSLLTNAELIRKAQLYHGLSKFTADRPSRYHGMYYSCYGELVKRDLVGCWERVLGHLYREVQSETI